MFISYPKDSICIHSCVCRYINYRIFFRLKPSPYGWSPWTDRLNFLPHGYLEKWFKWPSSKMTNKNGLFHDVSCVFLSFLWFTCKFQIPKVWSKEICRQIPCLFPCFNTRFFHLKLLSPWDTVKRTQPSQNGRSFWVEMMISLKLHGWHLFKSTNALPRIRMTSICSKHFKTTQQILPVKTKKWTWFLHKTSTWKHLLRGKRNIHLVL